MMTIGKFRHRVSLQNPNRSQSDYGAVSLTPQTYAVVWAAVEPLTGNERWSADMVSATVSHMVTIRYREDVKASHVLVFKGRKFQIESVTCPDEARELLILACKEAA